MSDRARRRTLTVRGWFALTAIATFMMVVVAVLASVVLLGVGEYSSQDRIDHAAAVIEDGGTRWRDPIWRERTASELANDDVSLVVYDADTEISRHPSVGSGSAGDDAADKDAIVRVVNIDGTAPPLTVEVRTALNDDNPFPVLLRATLLIGGIAAAVSLAFGRPFVRSLRAIRHAAGRVGVGDMAVELPRSRITEIDDVNTAFEAMADELDQSLRQQAELEHERRLFIAAIAHDLRTPLFALRGSLEGLDNGIANTAEKRARYLAIASEKALALDRLVNDLFDFTRLEYLDQEARRDDVDLVELLRDVVDGFQPQATGRTLTFDPPAHRIMIEADREQLARAATNLVDNALRYTPVGGQVTVICGADGGGAWFRIADTGPGIAAHDLPHIFQPLYRGDDGPGGSATSPSGTGLGLAIAQRVMAAHHGTLIVDNATDGGAVFTATIPSQGSHPDPTSSHRR